ncbi:sel1 repeat family protein [Oxalobacteraceae bacterium]|nr:sel1 repeat family protein [Oxalobacteraceae bacterium]
MNDSAVFTAMVKSLAIAVVSLLPIYSKAQAGFVDDLVISQLCMSQNWGAPNMQIWMKSMSKPSRMRLFTGIRLPSVIKQCLMKNKPVVVALCDKVIAQYIDFRTREPIGGGVPFQSLTSQEREDIAKALEKNKCKFDILSEENSSWVPNDLRPSASTMTLLKLAEKGDITAQIEAYALYTEGADVPKNEKRAGYWLRRAAIGGNVDAQYLTGRQYTKATGPSGIDFDQAIRFLTMAANQGHRNAMRALANIYEESIDGETYGRPVKHKSMNKALSWYTKGADLGDRYSAAALAYIFKFGNHVPVDLEKSFYWYEKSARLGYAEAMQDLSELYQNGIGTQQDGKMAQEWRRKADQLGVNGAAMYLINYFPWGTAPASPAEEASIQLKHAEAGDVNAQIALASRYASGQGVEKDEQVAIMWWRRAANMGDPIAQRMLGKYLMDENIQNPKQSVEAIQWLQKAVALGDLEAQSTMAFWYVQKPMGDNLDEWRARQMEAIRLIRDAGERGYRPEDSAERAEVWTSLLGEG